jgi:glycosyltransferase involved in cell wall biosynthesis
MHDAALDVTRLLGRRLKGRRPTGVDRVGLAYVEHLRARATALVRLQRRWLFFTAADSQRLFDLLLSEPGAPRPQQLWPLVRRALGMRRYRPAAGTWLVNAVHSGLEHPDYAPHVHRLGLRAAVFVHDLIPITHPQYCRAGEADRHRRRIDTALHHADALIVNSAATLNSLQVYAHASSLGMPPCEVAPLAPAPLTAPARAAAPQAPGPYFVTLGTIEPRKNHALLLQVWRDLRAQLGAAAPHLVVIGQPGWMCEGTLEELHGSDPARTNVIYQPSCSDAQLAVWLHGARALLFPSFAEGYGLPVLEALALGVPVIANDLPVLRETARHIPTYLDAHDAPAWRAEVLAYASDASLARQAQLARLRGFAAPSWAAHFARVDALMERSHARAA